MTGNAAASARGDPDDVRPHGRVVLASIAVGLVVCLCKMSKVAALSRAATLLAVSYAMAVAFRRCERRLRLPGSAEA